MMKRILHSFRRDDVQYVTKWQNKYKCYMGLMCWAIGINDFAAFTMIIINYGSIGLIPAALVFILLIVPMCYTELAIGQFSKCAYISCWKLSPPFKGIGYTCIYLLSFCTLHTNLTCMILLHYITGSVQSPVPWFTCDPRWSKEYCFVLGRKMKHWMQCQSLANATYCNSLKWENSAEHYWNQVIAVATPLLSTDPESLQRLKYSVITSILIFAMLRKGVGSVSFFVPVLALAPHILQFILFAVSLMQDGAYKSVSAFYAPNLSHLGNFSVWNIVMRQILTSTNSGLGGTIMFGSESGDFRTPIHMAAICIYIVDFLFASLFALLCCNSFVIFSYAFNLEFNNFIAGDILYKQMSSVFMTWPWVPQIWICMYFLNLYIMNVRMKVIVLHAFISGIYQIFPKFIHYYDVCAFSVVFIDFWASLSYYDEQGIKYITSRTILFNSTCTLIVIIYESIVIMFIYGTTNLIDDIHFMLGFRPSAYWKLCWYLCPIIAVILFGVCCTQWANFIIMLFRDDEVWFLVLLVVSLTLVVFWTPLYMLIYVLRKKKKVKKWYKLMKPSAQWGPADPGLRKSREMFTAHSMTKEYLYRQTRQTRQFVVDTD